MENIVDKHIFNFFLKNKTITCLQFRYVQRDSTVNQLVSIYDTLCKTLDEGKEARSVLLYKVRLLTVWHRGLICKLKQADIEGLLLEWLSH